MRRARLPAAVAILLVLLLLIAVGRLASAMGDLFLVDVLILVVIYACAGIAWNLAAGYTGLISMGHASLFGLGAYVAGFLLASYHVNLWVGMLAGAVVTGLVAVALGLPTFQLRGHYFVMATVALSAIVYVVVINWPALGGATGVYLPILRSGFLNLEFGRERIAYYWVGLGLLAVFLGVSALISESRLGYWFRAVRDDEVAAASVGVPVLVVKSIAIGLSGALTAVAGAFYAAFTLYISPDTVLTLILSVEIALVAILGGVGTLFGPLVGAAVLVPMDQYANAILGGEGKGIAGIVYAVIIILVALFEPRGLTHWLGRAGRAVATTVAGLRGRAGAAPGDERAP